jgi:4-hydroxybenzoate polyprenyltransferase
MFRIQLYGQLMRLHQPIGIWLLYWPCAWGIFFADGALPQTPPLRAEHLLGVLTTTPVYHLALFFVGSVVMRGAGCIVNDLWDRKIDAQVERTRNRPLASGAISVKESLMLLAVLLFLALWIVCQLPWRVFGLALLALPLVAIYPAMKRLTWWPQAFLGITFNFGVLMGWLAQHESLTAAPLWLYAAGIFWTLGYDTIYAHQDTQDDARIGVKSTARLFGESSRYWIASFFALMLLCFFLAGISVSGLIMLAFPLILQMQKLDIGNPARCGQQFRFHALYGALVWMVIVLL